MLLILIDRSLGSWATIGKWFYHSRAKLRLPNVVLRMSTVRIPLDYYRILGIPLQVTEEQISQAYQDRLVQLPRREYSEVAIASRKELLDRAYHILSDTEQRAEYTQKWWGTAENETPEQAEFVPLEDSNEEIDSSTENDDLDRQSPWIEISDPQLIGALLIFQELGEYELIGQYGEIALRNCDDPRVFSTSRQDLVLTIALANLELSREQWQNQNYEKASFFGVKALAWLQEENLHPTIQQEIRNELYRLRPYRILEKLTLSQDDNSDRDQGLQLLKEMIQDRRGIEGRGNDRSGLGTDDFLRFVQQLRNHLTVDEQLSLFVEESERPSAAASYLASYALIAKGFSQRKPSYLVQCQSLLNKFKNRQDTGLEEAICALLLGQTQLATQSLEKSQDQKALTFIQQRSEGSPDLLPGLCSYGESWLQTEIFSHFRDLADQTASLEDYFSDGDVQIYLETLSPDAPTPYFSLHPPTDLESPMARNLAEYRNTLSESSSLRKRRADSRRSRSARQASESNGKTGTATLTPLGDVADGGMVSSVKSYWSSPAESLLTPKFPPLSADPLDLTEQKDHEPRKKRKRKRKTVINPVRFGTVVLSSLIILGLGIFGVQSMRSPLNGLQGEQLNIQLNQAPLEFPNTASATAHLIPKGELTNDVASGVIEGWLSSKSKAFGQNHDIAALSTILAEPLLSQWQVRAARDKQRGIYRQYDHKVEIKSLKFDPNNANRASIQARVQEATKYYRDNSNAKPTKLQNDDLLVRYQLIRQNDQWRIAAIAVESSR